MTTPISTGIRNSPLTLAVVGHPNEGKSSVLATLAEDDGIRISSLPGETQSVELIPVSLDGVELFRLADTPGFQNPEAIAEWIRKNATPELSGKALFEWFTAEFAGLSRFHHDRELIRGLIGASALLYVIDGSRPVRSFDLAEMEILRMSGLPRVALINSKSGLPRFADDWKKVLNLHFSSIRFFDAHRAGFKDRIALIETLRSIQQDWEPLLGSVSAALKDDWERRIRACATCVMDHLVDTVGLKIVRQYPIHGDPEPARQKARESYFKAVELREARCFDQMRYLFKHRITAFPMPPHPILDESLFSANTWKMLGLSRRQLALGAAAAGAAGGAALDVAFSGITFGVFTAGSALIAGSSAYMGGDRLAEVKVLRTSLGHGEVQVGPNRNPNFPFVLLDRCLLFFDTISHWTHARRDHPEMSHPQSAGFTSKWTREPIQSIHRLTKAIRKDHPQELESARLSLESVLSEVLQHIASR